MDKKDTSYSQRMAAKNKAYDFSKAKTNIEDGATAYKIYLEEQEKKKKIEEETAKLKKEADNKKNLVEKEMQRKSLEEYNNTVLKDIERPIIRLDKKEVAEIEARSIGIDLDNITHKNLTQDENGNKYVIKDFFKGILRESNRIPISNKQYENLLPYVADKYMDSSVIEKNLEMLGTSTAKLVNQVMQTPSLVLNMLGMIPDAKRQVVELANFAVNLKNSAYNVAFEMEKRAYNDLPDTGKMIVNAKYEKEKLEEYNNYVKNYPRYKAVDGSFENSFKKDKPRYKYDSYNDYLANYDKDLSAEKGDFEYLKTLRKEDLEAQIHKQTYTRQYKEEPLYKNIGKALYYGAKSVYGIVGGQDPATLGKAKAVYDVIGDKLNDYTGITGEMNYLNHQTQIIQEMMDKKGVAKTSLIDVKDEKADYTSTINYKGVAYPKEKNESENKNVYDAKKILLDENNQPVLKDVLNERGEATGEKEPVYVDKYSLMDNLLKANLSAFKDFYWWRTQGIQGVESAAGFAAQGMGAGAIIKEASRKVSKVGNDILKEATKSLSPQTVKNISKTSSAVTNKLENILTTYTVSNAESIDIGEGVSKMVLKEQTDLMVYKSIDPSITNIKEVEDKRKELIRQAIEEGMSKYEAAQTLTQRENEVFKDILANNPLDYDTRVALAKEAGVTAQLNNNIIVASDLSMMGAILRASKLDKTMGSTRNYVPKFNYSEYLKQSSDPLLKKISEVSKISVKRGIQNVSPAYSKLMEFGIVPLKETAKEMFLEEGGANIISEKMGEAYGRGEVYDIGEYISQVGSAEHMEQAYAAMMPTMGQSLMVNTINTIAGNSESSNYKLAKKVYEEMNKLSSMPINEVIKKTTEAFSAKDMADNFNKYLTETEGKKAKTDKYVEDSFIAVKAVQAARTGNTENYVKIIDAAITEEVKSLSNNPANQEAKENIEKLNKVKNHALRIRETYEEYKESPFLKRALQIETERIITENELEEEGLKFEKLKENIINLRNSIIEESFNSSGILNTDAVAIEVKENLKKQFEESEIGQELNSNIKNYSNFLKDLQIKKSILDKYKEYIDDPSNIALENEEINFQQKLIIKKEVSALKTLEDINNYESGKIFTAAQYEVINKRKKEIKIESSLPKESFIPPVVEKLPIIESKESALEENPIARIITPALAEEVAETLSIPEINNEDYEEVELPQASGTNIEAKKADIEKRRQEAKNSIIYDEEVTGKYSVGLSVSNSILDDLSILSYEEQKTETKEELVKTIDKIYDKKQAELKALEEPPTINEDYEETDIDFFAQPISYDKESREQQRRIEQYKNAISKLISSVEKIEGRKPTANNIYGFFRSFDKLGIDTFYNEIELIEQALSDFGYQKGATDYVQRFKEEYGKVEDEVMVALANKFPNSVAEQVATKSIEEAKGSPIVSKEKNLEEDKSGIVQEGDNTNIPDLKIAFNSENSELKYVLLESGEYLAVHEKTEEGIKTDKNPALNVILDPEKLGVGSLLKVVVPTWEEVKNQPVAQWSKEIVGDKIKYSKKIVSFESYLKNEKVNLPLDENGNVTLDLSNPIVLRKLPLKLITESGEDLGYSLHDEDWYNTTMISDFRRSPGLTAEESKMVQKQVIQKGKEYVRELRKSVAENYVKKENTFLKVSERYLGHTKKQSKGNSFSSLASKAVEGRDFEIVVSKGEGNYKTLKNNTKNNKDFLNAKNNNSFKEIGDVVGRIFITVKTAEVLNKENGVVVDMELIEPVYNNTESSQDLYKELEATYKTIKEAYDLVNRIKNKVDKTPQQQEAYNKAFNTISTIENSFPDAAKLLKSNRLQYLYPGKSDDLYHSNFQIDLFNKDIDVPILDRETGKLISLEIAGEKGYKNYTLHNLKTSLEFVEIQTEKGVKKIVDIQPKIILEQIKENVAANFVVKREIENVTTINNIEEIKEELKKIENPVMEEITEENITTEEKQKVVDYFFHNVLNAIGFTKEVTLKEIKDKAIELYDNYLESIKDIQEVSAQYNYLKNNREELLGLDFSEINANSILNQIADYINTSFTEDMEENETVSQEQADHIFDKIAGEITVSLSTASKFLLTGIEKTSTVDNRFNMFKEYYSPTITFGVLQDLLSDTNNTLEALQEKATNKMLKNPDEFKFIKDVSDKIVNSNLQIQQEILHRLNQTKLSMLFIEFSPEKSIVRALNANSSDFDVKLKNDFKQNFLKSSIISKEVLTEDRYKYDLEKLLSLSARYNEWQSLTTTLPKTFEELTKTEKQIVEAGAKPITDFTKVVSGIENVSVESIKSYLKDIGLEVQTKTLIDYIEEKGQASLFTKGGLLYNINQNIGNALEAQTDAKNKDASDFGFLKNPTNFDYKVQTESVVNLNILFSNNNSNLKDIIKYEIENTIQIASSVYIAGKTLNAYTKPNYVSEKVSRLKNEKDNKALHQNMAKASWTRNNLTLKLLKIKNFADNFALKFMSPNALKKAKEKMGIEEGIVNLNEADYRTTLLGTFFSTTNKIKIENEELANEIGVPLRQAYMPSPPLADSHQLMLINTYLLDLKEEHLVVSGNEMSIADNVLNLIYSQTVLPDLTRIFEYNKVGQKVNRGSIDKGSKLFTLIPELNNLMITRNGEKVSLVAFLNKEASKKTNYETENGSINTVEGQLEELLRPNMQEIYTFLQSHIDKEVKKVVNIESVNNKERISAGAWLKNGIVSNTNILLIDKNFYLKDKGIKSLSEIRKAQLTAYDYIINDMISQANFHQLFSGDLANYVKAKDNVLNSILNIENIQDRTSLLFEVFNSTFVNALKRFKGLVSPGNKFANTDASQKHLQIQVRDSIGSSEVLEYLLKMFYKRAYTNEKIRQELKILKALENKIAENKENNVSYKIEETYYNGLKKSLKKRFPLIKSYFDITVADAMEYLDWRTALSNLERQGKYPKEDVDIMYEKLIAQESGDIENNRLNVHEIDILFQSAKDIYFGETFETVKDPLLNIEHTSVVQNFIKSSAITLIPEMTVGLKIDNVRKHMASLSNSHNGMNVRLSFESANKLGGITTALPIEYFYNDKVDYDRIFNNSSVILNTQDLSSQLEKPHKDLPKILKGKEREIGVASQMEKILLSGINKITRGIFNNHSIFKNLIDKTENLTGEDLEKIYLKIYKEEQLVKNSILNKKLGISEGQFWSNDIEFLKNLAKEFNSRLKNAQDKEAIQIQYYVGNQTYTEKQIKELGLTADRFGFPIPLWLSPNSDKFESQAMAMIDKNNIKLTAPGFSAPVASEEGFRKKELGELSKEEKSGIIKTKKFDGKLKATYVKNEEGKDVLKYAQVLVPNRLTVKKWNEETKKYEEEFANLKDFVDKDGYLDYNKIPEELLQWFSYRIPTSGHQSGVIIEVVGFLPNSMADVMVVPKDHTVQLGEDYDIDTRYIYTNNYLYNTVTKSFKLFTADNIKTLSKEQREREKLQNVNSDKTRYKILQNQKIQVYKSIFSSTDASVQKMINAVLNTDLSETTADLIETANNVGSKELPSLLSFDYRRAVTNLGASGKIGTGEYSNAVVINGLMSTMENKPVMKTKNTDGSFETTTWTFGNFTFKGILGNTTNLSPTRNAKFYDNYNFANISASEALSELQNVALDNQKLQIMGRVNQNDETLFVRGLMAMLRMNVDLLDNGTKVNYADLFLSQPILVDYVNLKNSLKGKIKESYKSIAEKELEVIEELEKKYSSVSFKFSESGAKYFPEDLRNTKMTEAVAQKLYDNIGKTILDDNFQWAVLETYLKLKIEGDPVKKVQKLFNIDSKGIGISYLDALERRDFIINDLTLLNEKISNISSVFGDIVKTFDDSYDNNSDYVFIGEDLSGYKTYVKPTNANSYKLVYGLVNDLNMWKNLFPYDKPYIRDLFKEIAINAGANSGTEKHIELMYAIKDSLKDFIYSSSKIIGITDINDVRYELFIDDNSTNKKSLATYVYELSKLPKYKNIPFFNNIEFTFGNKDTFSIMKFNKTGLSPFELNEIHRYFSLLEKSEEKLPSFNGKEYSEQSLLKDLFYYSLIANQQRGAIGFRNLFPLELFNKYGIKEKLNLFDKEVEGGISNNAFFNGIIKGLLNISNVTPLADGSYSLKNVSERNLKFVQLFVNKANASNPGAVSISPDKSTLVVNRDFIEQKNSLFVKQFTQHHPEKGAKKLSLKKLKSITKKDSLKDKPLKTIVEFQIDNKLFVDKYYYLVDTNGKIYLFEKVGFSNVYKRIPTLASFGVNEYNPSNFNQKSLVVENNYEEGTVEHGLVTITNPTAVETKLPLNAVLSSTGLNVSNLKETVNNIANDNGSQFQQVAQFLKEFINDGVKIVVDNSLENANAYYSKSTNTITISEKFLRENSKGMIQYAIMEELLHSVIKNIDIYVDSQNTYLNSKGELEVKYNKDAPAEVIKLVRLYKKAAQILLDKYTRKHNGNKEKAILEINQKVANWKNYTESKAKTNQPLQLDDTYRILNMQEFMVGMLLDKDFRKEFKDEKFASQNFLETWYNSLKDMFIKLLSVSENKSGTFNFEAMAAVIDFIRKDSEDKYIIKNSENVNEIKYEEISYTYEEIGTPEYNDNINLEDWTEVDLEVVETEMEEKTPVKEINGVESVFLMENLNTTELYSKLGNKTESGNVKIVENIFANKDDKNVITAFRVDKKLGLLESFKKYNAIGNPINWQDFKPRFEKDNATVAFMDWFLGKDYTNLEQEYRQEILNNLNTLKGKSIEYYKELNRPSHATALDYLINQLNFKQNVKNNKNQSLIDAVNNLININPVVLKNHPLLDSTEKISNLVEEFFNDKEAQAISMTIEEFITEKVC